MNIVIIITNIVIIIMNIVIIIMNIVIIIMNIVIIVKSTSSLSRMAVYIVNPQFLDTQVSLAPTHVSWLVSW